MPQMDNPGRSTAGRAVGTTIKGARVAARGGARTGRWAVRNVLFMRHKSAGGEIGMMRLLDLHAASCAGDTLVTMGLATTVFFAASVGEARSRVALYLFITMVPFAILAPIVGPVLDRFRHGRRYALAVTMLGRALFAWAISDYVHSFALYPAAFGVLALSRAYGVARSAAVPRLLPEGLGLSEAGARASIFGTVAGAVVAPLGVAALKIGPQWPLRVAAVIFVFGAVIALRLPPRADSDPPEVPPRMFQFPGRRSVRVLSGRLVASVLVNGAVLRAVFGFLALFLAFSIRSDDLTTTLLGVKLSGAWALTAVTVALGGGALLAPLVGSRWRIRRPLLMQAAGIALVAATAIFASVRYSLGTVIVLSLVAAFISGLAKLAVDATIQERIPEDVRASAFAHSETLLMLAWVAGGAIGLIPFGGRVGIIICAVGMAAAACYATVRVVAMHDQRLSGTAPNPAGPGPGTGPSGPAPAGPTSAGPGTAPTAPAGAPSNPTVGVSGPGRQYSGTPGSVPASDPTVVYPDGRTREQHAAGSWWARRRAAKTQRAAPGAATAAPGGVSTDGPSNVSASEQSTVPQPTPTEGQPDRHRSARTRVLPRDDVDQPGFHLYRPTSNGGGRPDDTPDE